MEIRQLKYFVGIVEARSISRAALALHVAQPALSLQMNRLEDEIGIRLLDRSVTGVTPTDAGKAVYRHAKQVLRQLEGTVAIAAQAHAGPAGPVVVGLPWTVSSMIGLPLLRRVLSDYPAIQLQIVEGPSSLLGTVAGQGRLDMAIVFDRGGDGTLTLRPLITEPLWLVGARGTLHGRRRFALAESAAFPMLLLSRPNGIREQLETAWAEAGLKLQPRAEIDSPGLLLEAIANGMGHSILPSAIMPDRRSRLRLDRAVFEEGRLIRTASLALPRQFAPSRAAECVSVALVACMKEAVADGRWKAEWMDDGDLAN